MIMIILLDSLNDYMVLKIKKKLLYKKLDHVIINEFKYIISD
jgi:hypothetical protein